MTPFSPPPPTMGMGRENASEIGTGINTHGHYHSDATPLHSDALHSDSDGIGNRKDVHNKSRWRIEDDGRWKSERIKGQNAANDSNTEEAGKSKTIAKSPTSAEQDDDTNDVGEFKTTAKNPTTKLHTQNVHFRHIDVDWAAETNDAGELKTIAKSLTSDLNAHNDDSTNDPKPRRPNNGISTKRAVESGDFKDARSTNKFANSRLKVLTPEAAV